MKISYANDIESGPIQGKFIIKLKKGVEAEKIIPALDKNLSFNKASKLNINKNLIGSEKWQQVYTFITPNKTASKQEIINLIGSDNIEYIEQDYTLEFFDEPTDHLYPHQWYLNNTGQEYYGILRGPEYYDDTLVLKSGTSGKDISISELYQNPPSDSTKIVIAIIDTGVDSKHPDLQGRIWRNPGEIPDDSIDNDNNGYIDDTLGYDVSGDLPNLFNAEGDNDPSDIVGHGTHIAGIIAANNDGVGVVGVAPWVEIMPIKIRPNVSLSVSVEGILYAVNSGAQIINISWGTPFNSTILKEALQFAIDNNVLVCIASGNTGTTQRFFPAAFDLETIVVAAGNSDGFLTGFTTFGSHIDIVAPGEDILSTKADTLNLYEVGGAPENNDLRVIDSLYILSDGTSMAAPIVAGSAALLWSFRPDLTMKELRQYLFEGANPISDPWGDGMYYTPGADTFSGHGYININQTLENIKFLSRSTLKFVEPQVKNRYTEDVEIKIASSGLYYSGEWQLEYIVGYDTTGWELLAEGTALPEDSIAYIFNDTTINGNIKLRLIDTNNDIVETSFLYVRVRNVELITPFDGEDIRFSFPVKGSVYGPDFDSLALKSLKGTIEENLFSSTGEHFDSLLYLWLASGNDTGSFTIILEGYFGDDIITDISHINISETFSAGWPQPLNQKPGVTDNAVSGITPVCADLDNDNLKELIVTTNKGILIFNSDGSLKNPETAPLIPGLNVICVPAIYDIDHDGVNEIIVTSDSLIHAVNLDGTYVEGWPRTAMTGISAGSYGYPNPVIMELGLNKDSVVAFLNMFGQVMAYRFNGDPYFYSLGGLFTSVDIGVYNEIGYNGRGSPVVTATDINNDGISEVVTVYSSNHRADGLTLFNSRTGEPLFDSDRLNENGIGIVTGAVLADLDRDSLYEIIIGGFNKEIVNDDTIAVYKISVKKNGVEDFDGWPLILSNLDQVNWISSLPYVADLDNDSIPEILVTFFTYGQASLYIFNVDGTPYLENSIDGEVFTDGVSFGNPIVADIVGDESLEILIRSGHLIPGMGTERLYVLNNQAELLPNFPIETPAVSSKVMSTQYAPLVDDFDGDGLVEVILYSNAREILVWDFDAVYDSTLGQGRFLFDNLNSRKYPIINLPVQTSINEASLSIPDRISLSQNYPNPFNPKTTIKFGIIAKGIVNLEVYNILGQKVATLVNEELKAGNYSVEFDGSKISTGIYFYMLKVNDEQFVKKMMLLK
ncbi:MAG: S8 family serine peptidase [candidate division Zixibacteria bacterium]|nr:S8 family serine peptidase [candidate division Zixibacteria bacterium]